MKVSSSKEVATLKKLDDYKDMLYEGSRVPQHSAVLSKHALDTETRVRATQLLLQLVQNPDNMEDMCSNGNLPAERCASCLTWSAESLLLALSRVLEEDSGKKNTNEHVANIIHYFFCLSKYSQFHEFISQYRIGRTALRVWMSFEQCTCPASMRCTGNRNRNKKAHFLVEGAAKEGRGRCVLCLRH